MKPAGLLYDQADQPRGRERKPANSTDASGMALDSVSIKVTRWEEEEVVRNGELL